MGSILSILVYLLTCIFQEGRKLGYSGMTGFPMVASSPIRHDLGMGGPNGGPPGVRGAADVHSYEPPWKALCDFALHSDLDKLSPAGNPQYQHLVHQVSLIYSG